MDIEKEFRAFYSQPFQENLSHCDRSGQPQPLNQLKGDHLSAT